MYEEYYGLTEKPFSLTPDPKYIYKSESHSGASDLLHYAVRRREGFVVVTGDIGTGKTTLCRALLEHIDRNTFTALVLNPFLSEDDLIKLILQDFGVVSREEIKAGKLSGVSKQELIDTLYDFLLSLLPLHASAVLIIDEAQNLPLEVLEQIRILSNLETDKEKLLQIILVGQMSLIDKLSSPELRQLDQRVSIRYELQPLTAEEAAAYVSHRLSVAGGSAIVFEPKSLQLVHQLSGGIPRLINLICDRTLLAAYAERTNRVLPDMVRSAAETLDLQPNRSSRRYAFLGRRWTSAAAALGAVAVPVALAAALGWKPTIDPVASAATPAERKIVASTEVPDSSDAVAPSGTLASTEVAAPNGTLAFTDAAASPAAPGSGEVVAPSPSTADAVLPVSTPTVDATLPVRTATVADAPLADDGVAEDDASPDQASPDQVVSASEPMRPYTLVVSSFSLSAERESRSLVRLERLTRRLEDMGYQVYHVDVDLGSRGWWRRVLVGSYDSRSDARRELARLQTTTREFQDARAVRSSTVHRVAAS